MKKRRHSRAVYNRGDGVVEIIVRTTSGGKEDMWTANQSDHKAHAEIGKVLKDKYDIDLTPRKLTKEDIAETGFFDY